MRFCPNLDRDRDQSKFYYSPVAGTLTAKIPILLPGCEPQRIIIVLKKNYVVQLVQARMQVEWRKEHLDLLAVNGGRLLIFWLKWLSVWTAKCHALIQEINRHRHLVISHCHHRRLDQDATQVYMNAWICFVLHVVHTTDTVWQGRRRKIQRPYGYMILCLSSKFQNTPPSPFQCANLLQRGWD